MRTIHRAAAGMLLVSLVVPAALQAQAPPQGQPKSQPQPTQAQVLATVNGDPITAREVQVQLQPKLQGREVGADVAQQLEREVVGNLIESRLVEQYVVEKGPEVKPQEVQTAVDQLRQQLAAQDTTLEQYAASRGHTPDSFQSRIEASLAWQKFQRAQLTEGRLAQYFQQNQQQFQAESFDEARQQVANAYLGELWQSIIAEMKPKAEIRVSPTLQQPQQPRPE